MAQTAKKNKSKSRKVDYLIIGGGTGGLRAALQCAHAGKTILVEPGVLGGTCLNTGCIPTKAMLQAAHCFEDVKLARNFGVTASPTLQFGKLMNRVRGIVSQGVNHIDMSVKKSSLTRIKAKATFIGKNKVKAGNTIITAKNILICTGASNFVPPIKGITDVTYLDNVSLIQLTKLPKSIVMIGGGYISMEFATFFAKLGVKVTVLERFPIILGMLDDDIREEFLKSYEKVDIITNCNILNVTKKGGSIVVEHNVVGKDDSAVKTVTAEQIVVATGRVPNTKSLNLAVAGVKTDKRGGVIVNDKLETSAKGVYAIGDCTGQALFAHAAKREVEIVLHNILTSKKKRRMPWDLMPWAVFTDPIVAGIGLSEKQAEKDKISYDLYTAPFKRAGRATIIGDTRGFVKVLTQKRTGKLLGAQIIGPHADDLIHEFIAFMQMGAKISDVMEMIHIHPTLAEVVASLQKH